MVHGAAFDMADQWLTHSMGYGDLYEASHSGFTPEHALPCAEGAAIFQFSGQVAWGRDKGYQPSQLSLGVPGWQYELGGKPLPPELQTLPGAAQAAPFETCPRRSETPQIPSRNPSPPDLRSWPQSGPRTAHD